MRELVTTLLDAVGLLLVAAGVGLAVAGLVWLAVSARGVDTVARGAGVTAAGVVVLAGSWLAARQGRPRPPRRDGMPG